MMRAICGLFLFLMSAAAHTAPIPDPPDVDARSYIVIDHASGEVLAERNADARVEPASITKVMLTYVVYDEVRNGRLGWEDEVLISEKAWKQGIDSSQSRMFLNVGSKVKLEELVRGIVIQSGNDASVAVAEHVAGSEDAFAELMNQYAKRLGMKNTHFTNAPGMPHADHYTTARDVAILGRALIRDFPEEYKVYAEREYLYNGIRQSNRNLLLEMDKGADGIKTGHTNSAGFCLLSSIKRDDRRLITALMGSTGKRYRAQASLELMNWGFRFFDSVPLFGPGKPIAKVRVWKGQGQQLTLGAPSTSLLLPRDSKDKMKLVTRVNEPLVAPVQKHQHLGDLEIKIEGETIRTVPIIALEAMPAGSWFQQAVDQLRLWISG